MRRGAIVLNELSGERTVIHAPRRLALDPRGKPEIYARTTNPPGATGDGMAMALRAGAILSDMSLCSFIPPPCICLPVPRFFSRRPLVRNVAVRTLKVNCSCIGITPMCLGPS